MLSEVDELLGGAALDACMVEDLRRIRATITTRLRSLDHAEARGGHGHA
jgi:hypothetical protein